MLLAKMQALGFSKQITSWFASFLDDRSQCVKINNFVSKKFDVTSGVPQGSHCGPILFLIFVNDLNQTLLSSQYLLFADDLKIFKPVFSIGDCILIQNDLNALSDWCNRNYLYLNISKCHVITFSRLKSPINFDYSVGCDEIGRVTVVEDLGVLFDSKVTFEQHIQRISGKALKLLGYISRTAKDFTIESLKILYCALIRSRLEYASVIWSPYYAVHIHQLEKIQNKFLRIIAYKESIPRQFIVYDNILGILNIKTLRHRRILIDLQTLYKIIHSLINCSSLLAKIKFSVAPRRTRNEPLFSLDFHRTNYGIYSPLTRMMRYGNVLLRDSDFRMFSSTLNTFKVHLHRIHLTYYFG